jgi:hypothetical protein
MERSLTASSQFTLAGIAVAADDGLEAIRRDVVVRARENEIFEIPTDVEVGGWPRSNP